LLEGPKPLNKLTVIPLRFSDVHVEIDSSLPKSTGGHSLDRNMTLPAMVLVSCTAERAFAWLLVRSNQRWPITEVGPMDMQALVSSLRE